MKQDILKALLMIALLISFQNYLLKIYVLVSIFLGRQIWIFFFNNLKMFFYLNKNNWDNFKLKLISLRLLMIKQLSKNIRKLSNSGYFFLIGAKNVKGDKMLIILKMIKFLEECIKI